MQTQHARGVPLDTINAGIFISCSPIGWSPEGVYELQFMLTNWHTLQGVLRDLMGVAWEDVKVLCNPCHHTNYHLKPFAQFKALPEKSIHPLCSYIFHMTNIFSFTDFFPQIFTSHSSLSCLSNKGYYLNSIFYQKSLKTPLKGQNNIETTLGHFEKITDFLFYAIASKFHKKAKCCFYALLSL